MSGLAVIKSWWVLWLPNPQKEGVISYIQGKVILPSKIGNVPSKLVVAGDRGGFRRSREPQPYTMEKCLLSEGRRCWVAFPVPETPRKLLPSEITITWNQHPVENGCWYKSGIVPEAGKVLDVRIYPATGYEPDPGDTARVTINWAIKPNNTIAGHATPAF